MASLLVEHSKDRSVQYELVGDVTTIGRDPSNNVVIDDPTVSARHASLTRSLTGYGLTDMDSTNGTRYNGALVTDAELKDGDEIRFGSVTAVFRNGGRSDQTEKFKAFVKHQPPALANATSRWSFSRKSATVAAVALVVISVITWSVIVRHQTERPTAATQTFDLVTLAKKTRNAVVLIEVFDSDRKEIASGSGFFVSADGLLITNSHVIDGAANAAAKTENGDILPIKGAIRVDRENDLAVLAVEGRNLPFLTLGQSEFLQTGDHVAVIGSPLGLEGSLSEGIISAKRTETDADRQWLQITAPISPGSSGSPVLDSSGKVIGIATLVLRGGQSVNFAVPVELAVAMLRTKDKPKVHLANFDIENKADPSAPIPLELIARASALDNDTAEAAVLQSAEYQQVESASLKATAAAYSNSIGRYEQADWAKALTAAKALVAKYPNSGFASGKLASVYEQMGFLDEAITAYQHALNLKPEDADSWASLGLIYKAKGNVTQADFAFSQAIAFQQKTVESQRSEGSRNSFGNMALWKLGDIYHSAGNDEAAKGCFSQAMQENPESIAAVMSSGPLRDIYLSEGNEKAALYLTYQMMLNPNRRVFGAASPPEAAAWADLGDWYSKHGREADSLRCFQNAIGLGLPH